MSVPTNLIPTKVTGLPEYLGSSTLGYLPYIIDGRTYKVQFANIAAVGAVPSTREINTGSGLGGGGDLSTDRTLYILPGGVDDSRLSVTGVAAGTYGAADSVPVFTVNAQGRVTGVTNTPIVLSNYVPTSRTITAGAGLTGGGDLSANRSFAVNFSSTTPEPLGPGSPGVSTVAARGDHVHPAVDLSDTTETQGVLPLSRGGTGNSLSPVVGAIAYSSNDKLYLTPTAGTAGQVLVSAGGVAPPEWQSLSGLGTVTSVAVATANGFAGTVVDPTTTPIITLSTTVTGLLKGNGTGVSAATVGVDYVGAGPYTTSGLTMASARLLGRTTASVGAAEEITVGTGLTLSGGSLVNAAPDQVVSLTGAGTTTITGAYPSFTITSADSTLGTVTSVNASGGTTGLSFTGGPITAAGTLTLGGTLAIASGGTGAADAATALTNLGAYPASNPAGYTTNIGTVTSVSGTGTVSGLSLSGTVTSSGSLTLGGTLAVLPSNFASQTANTVLAAPNGTAGVPTFRAIVAADVPTLNQNTTGTASNVTGIVAVANGGTGASVAATARTNLSAAASGANTDITSVTLTTGTISTTPTGGTDIVNKAYADSIASGINFHQSVRLATTTTLPAYTYNNGTSGVGATLTANANGALSIDGVAVVATNRVLIKNEIGAAEAYNGIYTVTQVGNGSTPYILTRATDFDSAGSGVDQIDAGDFFLVTAGSTQANTSWVQQTPLPIVVGTTALVFTQFAAPVLYSAGTGLTLTGTVFSITNTGVSASTYGSASSVPVLAINAQGQVTSASSSSIAIAASQITSGALAIANGGTGATSAATALTNLGAYPASNPNGYTSNTGTVTSVNLTAGTGVSVSGGPITTTGAITVTNTAPDQIVSLTGSGATTVTGTYPNFTISSPSGGTGTVTSIDVSGGTTGLTTSGGPVTSSGTITFAGTLNVANGGTGATTLTSGYLVKGNGASAVSASVVYDNGTNVGIGMASPAYKLDVSGQARSFGTPSSFSQLQSLTQYTGSAGPVALGQGSDATGFLINIANASLAFGTNNTERVRIGSGGNVLIGTTSIGVSGNANTILSLANGNTDVYTSLKSSSGPELISGATPVECFSGTFTNSPYVIRTNNTERMRIDASGNVGIGTSSPSTRLEASQSSFGYWTGSSWTATPTAITITNTNVGGYDPVLIGRMTDSGGTSKNSFAIGTIGTSTWTAGNNATQTADMYFAVRDNAGGITERMRINSTGNVGIGTSAPTKKLSIGTTAAAPTNGVNILYEGTEVASFTSNASTGEVRMGATNGVGTFFSTFYSNNTERMRIDASGNVGIGTATPSTNLGAYTGLSIAGSNAGLQLQGSSFSSVLFGDAANVGIGSLVYDHSVDALRTFVNGAERMRIDASGNVLINRSGASGFGKLNVDGGADFTGGNVLLCRDTGNVGIGTSGPNEKLEITGSVLLSWADDRKYWMSFNNDFRMGTRLDATTRSTTVFATGAAGDGGSIRFNTDASTGNASTNYGIERMRITAAGLVGIGLTPAHLFSVKAATDGVNSLIAGATKAVRVNHTTTETRLEGVSQDGTTFQPLQIGGSFVTISESGTEVARFTGGNLALGTTNTTAISGYTSLKINNGTNGAILDLAQGDTYRGRLVGTTSALAIETNTGLPIVFSPAGTERARIHASGGVSIGNTVDTGVASLNVTGNVVFQDRVYTEMMAPPTKAAAATLTGAEVMGQYIQYTGSAATLTMPTGTNLQAAMPAGVAALNNISFDFTLINTGSGNLTLAVNTGITNIGTLLTTGIASATTFRIRKTATNTFIIYRT